LCVIGATQKKKEQGWQQQALNTNEEPFWYRLISLIHFCFF
jgi:hypothetical protein